MNQFHVFQDYIVVGYKQDFCYECPPDIIGGIESCVVRNKEVRQFNGGRVERVCLVCEFKSTIPEESIPHIPEYALKP